MENRKIYGYVYLITNLINSKQYVGQTVQKTIKKRFEGHIYAGKKSINMIIVKAIKKYGKENFIIQELAIAYNQEELTFLEGMYMSWFNTIKPNGYNIKKIINNKGRHSEETKEKIRIAHNKPENLKTASENGKNSRGKTQKKTNSSSKYCGVRKINNKWHSRCTFNYNTINIGYFLLEEDAAKAYDITAIKYFGNDCILNFPELREKYINNEIIVKKQCWSNNSKSGIKGIRFIKSKNKWQVKWIDKNLNKYKSFNTLEEAIKFKALI